MNHQHLSSLSINGGPPIRTRSWPKWPQSKASTLELIQAVLLSDDWSLTGHSGRTEPLEMMFARRFAAFYGANWCVPTSSGSTAIMSCLLAIDLRPGDEVLMPGNAWVACAAAALVLGGRAVLVDIDPMTHCMCVEDLEKKITQRSRAILLVHQNGAIADARRTREVADRHGLTLIEDCSHAHGALVGSSKVGLVGHASIFSMQKTKLLSSGEGGAILTDDRRLFERMARARASGRLHTYDLGSKKLDIDEHAYSAGGNFILSEFHAALLLDRLSDLDRENLVRRQSATFLSSKIASIPYVEARVESLVGSERVFHKFVISLNSELLHERGLMWYSESLSAELGLAVSPLHVPLTRNSLLTNIWDKDRTAIGENRKHDSSSGFGLPQCEAAYASSLSFRHYALLGTQDDMSDIYNAIEKVIGAVMST